LSEPDEGSLERLLDFDRRRYWLRNDWSVQFRVCRVQAHTGRPAGIKYSLTLHDDIGQRLLGFDNAHAVRAGATFDHRHWFRNMRLVKPYVYSGPDQLLVDFFEAVETACGREGIAFEFDDEDVLEDGLIEDDDDT
jgi:Family of unknown function (DUF6516)